MIFLSASIPNSKRDEKYFKTSDSVAIRDAVRALATVVIPETTLVWGGHPAITPLIRYVVSSMGQRVQDHVVLYQSKFFRKDFPVDNEHFERVILTDIISNDRQLSLNEMRYRMLGDNKFQAGIFIGGMEGVEDEFNLFRLYHPQAAIIPIASTGAAAKFIYNSMSQQLDERLNYDYAYMALFRSIFKGMF